MIINVNSVKALAPVCPNIVKHFCRTASRLHGQIAFREQLNMAEESGKYTTFQLVEADMQDLQQSILHTASECRTLLIKLNVLAKKHNIRAVCTSLDEVAVSGFITATVAYVEELVAKSDYSSWINHSGWGE